MRQRTCGHPRCDVTIGATKLACSSHWWALPEPIRHEVTVSYRQRAQDPRRHLLAVGAAARWWRSTLTTTAAAS
jgi:hypothetical protein